MNLTMTLLSLLAFVLLTAGTALFVAAEFALTALERSIVEANARTGGRRDQFVLKAHRTLSFQLSGAQLGISITTLATLAAQWLAPRLGAFQLANPGLAVRLDTNPALLDLSRESFDVGIRSGYGDWPGLESQLLMPSVFTPLCSPAVAERLRLTGPGDLLEAPRIGLEKEWAAWFAAAGVDAGTRPASRLAADYQVLEVAAALADQGVALASPILFAREIRTGLLVRPFPQTVAFHTGYFLVWPEGRRRSPKIKRFRDWLMEQAEADPTVAEARAAAA